jgi:hypothetical protein
MKAYINLYFLLIPFELRKFQIRVNVKIKTCISCILEGGRE